MTRPRKKPEPPEGLPARSRPGFVPAKPLLTPTIRPLNEPFRGQPNRLPDGWQDFVLEELRMCPIISKAAREAGVSRRTVYTYMQNEPDFEEAVKDAIEEGKDRNDEILVERRDRGDAQALMFLARAWRYGDGKNASAGVKDTQVTVGWEGE